MKITLFRGEKCWAARYSGHGSERILKAFETDTLRTAFTPEEPSAICLRSLAD